MCDKHRKLTRFILLGSMIKLTIFKALLTIQKTANYATSPFSEGTGETGVIALPPPTHQTPNPTAFQVSGKVAIAFPNILASPRLSMVWGFWCTVSIFRIFSLE